MWSLGCIVSEMLRVLLKVGENSTEVKENENKALFQGEQCFPISPKFNDQKETVIDSKEQLVKILEIC